VQVVTTDLVPRLGDALELLQRERRPVSRQVVRAIEAERGHGMVRAARVEARAQVAEEALRRTALLSMDEERFIQMAPIGESRYKAIVDEFAIFAAWEVRRP
jgi:hypothetical protein